ncbi:putative leucine-rich repeat-containing protein DDB_G0290503 [Adelges cooleyi]|uniref:putative leucine-rich repeat-containing protein DDB_G0290503 n=1 Tax=Adelges cooleyi TaxID=133065 RepID=UPI00217F9DD2|nr:putative leucine-rich repeat-containing protein DDB_G0290503 [Adelges cooleyi]
MSSHTHNDQYQLSNEKKLRKKRKLEPLSKILILEEIIDLHGKQKKFKKNHNSSLTLEKSDEHFNDISKKECDAKTKNRTSPHKRKSESVLENLVWDCLPAIINSNDDINSKRKKIKKYNRSLISEDPHHTFNDISEVKSNHKSKSKLMKNNKNDNNIFVSDTMYKNVEQSVNDQLFDYKKKGKKKKKERDTKKNENVNNLFKAIPVNVDVEKEKTVFNNVELINTNNTELDENNQYHGDESNSKKKRNKSINKGSSPKKDKHINRIIKDSFVSENINYEKDSNIINNVQHTSTYDTNLDVNDQSFNSEIKAKKKKKKSNKEGWSQKNEELVLGNIDDELDNMFINNLNTNNTELNENNHPHYYEKKSKNNTKTINEVASPKKNKLINRTFADRLIPKSTLDKKENIMSKDIEYMHSKDIDISLNNQPNNYEKKSTKKKKKHNHEESSLKQNELVLENKYDKITNNVFTNDYNVNTSDSKFSEINKSQKYEKKSKKKNKMSINEECSSKKNNLMNKIIKSELICESILDEKENIMSKDVEYINSKDIELDLNNQSNNYEKKSKKKKKKHNHEELSLKQNKLVLENKDDKITNNVFTNDFNVNTSDSKFSEINKSQNYEKKSKKKNNLVNKIIRSELICESILDEKENIIFKDVEYKNSKDIELDLNNQSNSYEKKKKKKHNNKESTLKKNELINRIIKGSFIPDNENYEDDKAKKIKKKRNKEESSPKKNGKITEKKKNDDDDLFKNVFKHINTNDDVYQKMLKKKNFYMHPFRSFTTSSLNQLTNNDIDHIRNFLDEELDEDETEVSFNSQKMFEDILKSEIKSKTHCHIEIVKKEYEKKIPHTIDFKCGKATPSEISLLKEFGKKLFDKLFQKYDVPEGYINLDIKLPSDAKKVDIHYIETSISHSATKEQMMVVKRLDPSVKKGAFSKEEDDIIRYNWSQFQQEFNIKNRQQFIANGFEMALARKQRFNFFRYLSQGLPHRLLYSVFTRFNKLFGDTEDRLDFAEEEDKLITKVHKCNAIREKLSFLSVFLKRSTIQLCKRWGALKLIPFRAERVDWTEDLRQKLFTNILLVTKTKNWRDLRKRTIVADEWKKIVKGLPPHVTFQRAIGFWNFKLKNMLFTNTYLYYCTLRLTVLEYLLELNPKKWTDINWPKLTKTLYPDLSRDFVHTLFHGWFKKRVPKELQMDTHKTLMYISENLKEQLISRINRERDTMLQRLTVKSGLLVKVEDENYGL